MPRMKISDTGFTWKGKPVSKTTYFRRKAEQKMMSVSEEDLVRLPKLGEPSAPHPDKATSHEQIASVGDHVDDALLRDLMVTIRPIRGQFSLDTQVAMAPRTFFAILRVLEKAGY